MTREELEKFLMETLVQPLERERDAIEQKIAEKDRELEEERRAKKQQPNPTRPSLPINSPSSTSTSAVRNTD